MVQLLKILNGIDAQTCLLSQFLKLGDTIKSYISKDCAKGFRQHLF